MYDQLKDIGVMPGGLKSLSVLGRPRVVEET